jgi:hypothetical protein
LVTPELSDGLLFGWFDRLVKNKMAGVAVAVCGVGMSCFILTFSKLFGGAVYFIVSSVGSGMLMLSGALFVFASYKQVFVSYGPTGRRSEISTADNALRPDAPD